MQASLPAQARASARKAFGVSNQRSVPGPGGRGAVTFDQADAALLELDAAARAEQARRQLAEVGLVADQRQAPMFLRRAS